MAERTRETTGSVADSVRHMYASYGEPARFDSHLHPEITIWESDQPGPLIGLPELDRLRGRRDAGSEPRPELLVEDLLVDRWPDAAVARYVLRARTRAGDTTFRVTDVWDLAEGSWKIVHHHAEQVQEETAVQSPAHLDGKGPG